MMRAKFVLSSLSFSLLALGACGGSQDEPAAAAGESTAAVPAAQTPAAIEPAAEAAPAAPAASNAPAAPDFTLPDLDGKQVTLSSFRGKTVVLEWFNPGCPFVRYAHGEGPLKDMARKVGANGVVWLAINSGSAGKQGAGADVNRQASKEWSMQHPVLIDENGQVGKSYGAKTTPHMYVVDPTGKLVYAGAIDDTPSTDVEDVATAKNYVVAALDEVLAGKPVTVATSQPYGCDVKY